MNLRELKAAVASYAVRTEEELPLALLITLAESKFIGSVRHRLAERQLDIPIAKGVRSFTLPQDFQAARSIKIGGRPLTLASIDTLDGSPGCTDRYAIVGNAVHLHSAPADPITVALTYYARVPALTEAAPTNWLLTSFPDIYLYGVLVESAIWDQNTDAQARYAALLGVALGNLATDHARSAYSGSTLRVIRP